MAAIQGSLYVRIIFIISDKEPSNNVDNMTTDQIWPPKVFSTWTEILSLSVFQCGVKSNFIWI